MKYVQNPTAGLQSAKFYTFVALVTPLFSAYLRLFMLRACPQAESGAYAKTLTAAAVPGNNEVIEVHNALVFGTNAGTTNKYAITTCNMPI